MTYYECIKVNPKIQREIIHYLVDKAIDRYHLLEAHQKYTVAKSNNPGLKKVDFWDSYFPAKDDINKRFRSEQIEALTVWEEWIRNGVSAKKGFPQIAKKLNVPLSTVKSRWYKAYVLLNRKPYDPEKIKKELKGKADELCSKCYDVSCYKEGKSMSWIPCPDYIKIAGKEYQREKTMNEKEFHLTHFGEIQEEDF